MDCTTDLLQQDWPRVAAGVRDQSLALALGLFDAEGEMPYLNHGMRVLLGGGEASRPSVEYFVNPRFSAFWDDHREGQVFEGLLTLGDGLRSNRSLAARAWRQGGQLLVAAEYDVQELDRLNTALSRTNQEINNLQRELLKKNRLLEDTLAKLRRTQAMLIHSEKMNALGQLVAGVAHEINNPLGFVTGNVHSLKESVADLSAGFDELETLAREQGAEAAASEVRRAHEIDYAREDLPELFGATLEGLDRVKGIVENLRSFSRLHEAERKEADLAEGLRSTLALAATQLKEKDIQVSAQLDVLPPIECYPAELNQVFMNLIVNAVQAMQAGGRLRIASAPGTEPGWVELVFEDDGEGIPEDVIGKIFDPFFTTKPVGSGTGLGLSIVHEIVTEHHGGRITVASEAGSGARFTLHLPPRLPEPAS